MIINIPHSPLTLRPLLIITAALGIIASAIALTASPRHPRHPFASQGGRLMVFPGDSLDLAAATFTIDGDTVSRETFYALDRSEIATLTVTPLPANLIAVTTRAAQAAPLDAAMLPDDVDYVIDGVQATREAFTALAPEAISSMAVVRGPRPRIEIITTANPSTPRD